VLGDTRIKRQYDLDTGIAAQTMMLGAVERGFGGCMMSSVKRGTGCAAGASALP